MAAPLTIDARPLRVCLVVDNPLRDLDGLILLAHVLVTRGCEVALAPMYGQAFTVAATRPDVVIVNYVRPNNRDLVRRYRRSGIRVVVLDTEGVGGRDADEFARLVIAGGARGSNDLYCTWGPAQAAALAPLLNSAVVATGCPRYDYCAPPWRAALPVPPLAPGYVLLNTNFPTVNPRFSRGAGDERRNAVATGFDAAFADAYLAAAARMLEGVVAMAAALAERLPARQFVLRPHPFEDTARYERLAALPNFAVRQSGTSLEWLAACSALVHLNCSTAVEATMLGRPAFSPGWLNDPTLRVPGPAALSRFAPDLDALARLIDETAAGQPPSASGAGAALIRDNYLAIDGRAAERVAAEVAGMLVRPLQAETNAVPLRFRAADLAQRTLGPRAWFRLVERLKPGSAAKRAHKGFEAAAVQALLTRLAVASGTSPARAVSTGADGGVRVTA